MDRNDLLKMLDLDAAITTTKGTETHRISKETPNAVEATSRTVFELDEWDMYRGCKYHQQSKSGVSEAAALDFFAMMYKGGPKKTAGCVDRRREEYIDTIMGTPEYKNLRGTTMLNELASEMAAEEFAKGFAKLEQEDRENSNKRQPRNQTPQQKEAQQAAALFGAVAAAVGAAEETVEEAEEIAAGLGIGKEAGGMRQGDASRVVNAYKRVRRSGWLQKICQMAGRYRRMAQSKQRQKQIHGFDDMVGVKLDGDVGKLLPSELAMLGDPTFELDMMRKIVERQAMCRDYRGIEQVGKGPIVVWVDESSSMETDDRIYHAKAFALAMAWIARQQKRWFAIGSFASSYEGRLEVLSPKNWDELRLIHWLENFYKGGTSMVQPFQEYTKEWDALGCPKGKTDMVVITDGAVDVPFDMEVKFKEWKQREKVRLISLVIGYGAGELEKVSDELHLMPHFDVNEEGVGNCLSI